MISIWDSDWGLIGLLMPVQFFWVPQSKCLALYTLLAESLELSRGTQTHIFFSTSPWFQYWGRIRVFSVSGRLVKSLHSLYEEKPCLQVSPWWQDSPKGTSSFCKNITVALRKSLNAWEFDNSLSCSSYYAFGICQVLGNVMTSQVKVFLWSLSFSFCSLFTEMFIECP